MRVDPDPLLETKSLSRRAVVNTGMQRPLIPQLQAFSKNDLPSAVGLERWFRPAKFGHNKISTSFRPQGVVNRTSRNSNLKTLTLKNRIYPIRAQASPIVFNCLKISCGAVLPWSLLRRGLNFGRCQAEIPLIALSNFAEPALSGRRRRSGGDGVYRHAAWALRCDRDNRGSPPHPCHCDWGAAGALIDQAATSAVVLFSKPPHFRLFQCWVKSGLLKIWLDLFTILAAGFRIAMHPIGPECKFSRLQQFLRLLRDQRTH